MQEHLRDRKGLQAFRRIACRPVSGRENVGGQAVIEGVMMRSPSSYATAVRLPDGGIVVKKTPFVSLTRRFRFLNLPILRGAIHLVETLIIGVTSLSFSAEQAMEEEREPDGSAPSQGNGGGSGRGRKGAGKKGGGGKNRLALAGTLVVSLALGLVLFFFLPLWATELLGIEGGVAFNAVDGAFRLLVFFAYLAAIARWKEMDRVFQYHGAEHKSIYAYENGDPLAPESAAPYTTLHPRCGTSFLLTVMIVSVLVFVLLGRPESWGDRLLRLAFVPVIGGLSYEFTKLSAHPKFQAWIWPSILPGLLLQKVTTQEPTPDMLEVAFVALETSLDASNAEGVRALPAREASAS
jgi:uncharacterized protein YqhQ